MMVQFFKLRQIKHYYKNKQGLLSLKNQSKGGVDLLTKIILFIINRRHSLYNDKNKYNSYKLKSLTKLLNINYKTKLPAKSF